MAGWVFCNRCFQPPRSKSRFSLTNCGHVYCDGCRGQGKKDECLICKVPCRTVFLSKNTDAEIQAFFMGIDSLCRKYSQETSQISEFQEKHRRRLLAFYREKISKLEESLRKLVLQIEQLQSVRSSQQTAFGTVRTSVPPAPARPRGCLLLPTGSSAPDRVESMEVDLTPSPVRRPQPEVAAGPTRMSLISPPQDGRMGSVSYRGPQHLGLTPHQTHLSKALRIPPLQIPQKGPAQTPAPQAAGRAARGGSPGLGGSQAAAPRPPISISGLLHRPCPGSARRGGVTHR
ncbi:probable E3 SUMO-protein ligase RNF212 isoform X5 [Lepus europaeus]|uniref:probable E3 SUMO-protein ligase RNF212 isoform X5 n=1 Tax=Lepus europaeus TaxID=9983 RepID=UPI002B48A606|nr:probable E3 SUMO-protein ligase RNF212 isoform X5 [Lepus europaeus]